jgi:hypothetical protein
VMFTTIVLSHNMGLREQSAIKISGVRACVY